LDHDDTAEDEDAEDSGQEEILDEQDEDEGYRRVRRLLDGLLENGRKALEQKPEDFIGKAKGGAKVLHADELREDISEDVANEHNNDFEGDDDTSSFILDSQAKIFSEESSKDSEHKIVVPSISRSSSPIPPQITIGTDSS
jgi:hypothetical protein